MVLSLAGRGSAARYEGVVFCVVAIPRYTAGARLLVKADSPIDRRNAPPDPQRRAGSDLHHLV